MKRRHPSRCGPTSAFAPVLLAFGLILTGCGGADDRHIFSLEGQGAVEGVAFLDLDRNGTRSGGEPALEGVQLQVIMAGSRDTVASRTTGPEGEFRAEGLAPGTYELRAGGPVLGDSLEVTAVTPEPVQIAPNGTASASVGISFPVRGIPQIWDSSPGTRLYVEGILLNARGSLPDNAVHIWDGERAIRALEAEAFTANPGDSVRLLGRVESTLGQTVLTEPRGWRLEEGPAPEPIALSTQAARSAQGGGLDGALVQVNEALVSDVRAVGSSQVATASDGSGSLQIRIPNAHLSAAGITVLQAGAVLSVTGLLVRQEGANQWELRTRTADDLTAEAQGGVTGRAFFDRNGSGSMDAGDTPLADVRLRLFRTTDLQTPVAEVTSDAEGRFQIAPLDVNSYVLEVDEATIPDSLVVRSINPGTIEVPTGGGVDVSVVISHPQLTSAEIRELPEGETVFLQGIALNARSALGDNSVHIRDDDGALRTLQVDATVLAGDRLRVRGRTARVAGQVVLTQVTPFVQSEGGVPGPLIRTTAQARTAAGGVNDGDAIRVREVTVVASHGNNQRWIVTVDDGTGQVDVYVRLASVGLTSEEAAEKFQSGERLNINGLLIPEEGANRWRVHPRTGGDLATIDP